MYAITSPIIHLYSILITLFDFYTDFFQSSPTPVTFRSIPRRYQSNIQFLINSQSRGDQETPHVY